MDMFNLLGIKKASFDIEHAREHANSIANIYFQSGEAPTATLIKTAQVEGFTPEQIKIVAKMVNQTIHNTLYKTAAEKYHAADFPLADVSKVLEAISIGGTTKVASQFIDPILDKDYGPSVEDMFNVKVEETDKTASVRHQVKHAMEKTALLRSKIEDNMSIKNLEIESAERNFMKEARQMVMQESLTTHDRYTTLGTIYHFAKQAGFEEIALEPLAKLAYVLGREGTFEPSQAKALVNFFTKQADCQVPEHLISKNLNGVEVVNGEHPLYISLNTLAVHKRAKEGLKNRFKMVQDTLEGLEQRIRAL